MCTRNQLARATVSYDGSRGREQGDGEDVGGKDERFGGCV